MTVAWGPTGETVYKRTYSRTKPDGSKETWPETAQRVAEGNLALVYGPMDTWDYVTWTEYEALVESITKFEFIPAGRQLWASGVKGRQYLFNCHVAGWGEKLSDHFEFSFLRLMEGGGVGANYSSNYLEPYGAPRRHLKVHIVCDPAHADYQDMRDAGLLSGDYHHEWEGAFPIEDSREGWAAALVDLLDTYMTDDVVHHENRVYDVSRVRGKGQPLRTFGGHASGPLPLATMLHKTGEVMNEAHWSDDQSLTPIDAMEIDHAIAECVVSGGVRRSARMSQVHWDDPYIEDFIACKTETGSHWTTNISVEVDEEFVDLLGKPDDGPSLYDGDEPIYESLTDARIAHAHRLHEQIVKGMLTNGEPGYWNSSLSNEGEVNDVQATNPCGEIALEAWENCNLGHVNLDAFSARSVLEAPDIQGLHNAHYLATRFLIRATFGDMNDPKQEEVVRRNRRIGVGHLGVQGFLAKSRIRYSRATESQFPELLDELSERVRTTAREYAFELRIPEPVKVTTVAPTGSIAKLPGVTEGIHPVYAKHFLRRVRFSKISPAEARQVLDFLDQGYQVEVDQYDSSGNTVVVVFPTKDKLVAEVEAMGLDAGLVESADELSLESMLAFQAMYQKHYADNAVSFTANIPEGEDPEYVAAVVAQYLPELKGTTIMVDGTRPQAPYERISAADFALYELVRVEDGTDEDCATGACPVR